MFDPMKRTRVGVAPVNVDGEVKEVLKGCGVAVVLDETGEEISINKGTEGVHFDDLRVGQKVNCDISVSTGRVIHAHQQTQPMEAFAGKRASEMARKKPPPRAA